ncbi:MAG: YXWGXW repeat-containing protein [Chitinophagaceae bacterium]|nr:YXWGXW repeat-containing protein [Chitinophagaceae bacterium]
MKYAVLTSTFEKTFMKVSKSGLCRMGVIAVLTIATCFTFSSVSAQVYVTVRPTYAPVVRPVPPRPNYVWIEEDWAYRGGHYVAVGGHWVAPPRPGVVWIPGRWVQSRRGWRWIPGHWRRR